MTRPAPAAAEASSGQVDDLALLPRFDEQSVLALLQQRYHSNRIYTNVNTMLLALNPYTEVGLYTPSTMRLYGGAAALESPPPPPHVFALAAAAYRGLLELSLIHI